MHCCRIASRVSDTSPILRLSGPRRRLSSILPKFAYDRKSWPSTLASTKATVDLEALENELKSSGVKYLMPAFVDMHGIPKAKMVPLDHLYGCSKGSELFTGAAVDGVPQEISDDEVCAVADPATMVVPLPHKPEVAYMPSSLYYRGAPFEPCSRNIYSRQAAKAKEVGFMFKLGVEASFHAGTRRACAPCAAKAAEISRICMNLLRRRAAEQSAVAVGARRCDERARIGVYR